MTSLLLKIDFAATPVTGTRQDEDGRQHEFVGWLGMSDVLRRIGAQVSPRPALNALGDGAEPNTRR
jgi:hypothetical protein